MSGKIKAINPEIIVKGCADKPYYQIKYYDKEDKIYHYGFGSYDYGTVLLWLREYFEPIQAEEQPVNYWHWDDSYDGITPFCSVCGRSHHTVVRTPNYCPNCGAKMDEQEEKQNGING